MEVLITKIIALCVLVTLTVVFGLAPFKLYNLIRGPDQLSATFVRRREYADLVVSCLLHFGGGVLLSTGFLHMIPEVRENVVSAMNAGIILKSRYPFAELFICCGFFLVYMLELIVHSYLHPTEPQLNGQVPSGRDRHDQAVVKLCPNEDSVKLSPCDAANHSSSTSPEEAAKNNYGSLDGLPAEKLPEKKNIGLSLFRGCLIVIALSFHSVFEGMAIGLQPSDSGVWTLFTAVTIHKLVITFCVGTELTALGTKFKMILLQIIGFALMSPIGIGIGILIMQPAANETATNGLIIAIFQGLAAGTLIYVTFFEILMKDKDRRSCVYTKLLCNLSGFSLLSAVDAFSNK